MRDIDLSNVTNNITATVHIPSSTPKGKTQLTGSLYSLLGALNGPNLEDFTVKIAVGDHTSSQYVESS